MAQRAVSWQRVWNASSAEARRWARHYAAGGARSACPSLAERQGMLLQSLLGREVPLDAPTERTGPDGRGPVPAGIPDIENSAEGELVEDDVAPVDERSVTP